MFIVGFLTGLFLAGFVLFAGGFVIKKREKNISIAGVKISGSNVKEVKTKEDKLDN